MMALRHFTLTTADGVVHKCCEDDRTPGAATITAKALIVKRDDGDEPDDLELSRTLFEEFATALSRGQMLVTGSGPNSVKLLDAMHRIARLDTRLTRDQAFAQAFASLSESEQSAVVNEELQALSDRLAAERAAEDAARARSLEIVGKGATEMETSIATRAEAAYLAGRPLGKSAIVEAINARGREIARPGESPQQAFTRAMMSDAVGRDLAKAMAWAIGPDHEPAPVEKREAPVLTGAAAEIAKLAAEYRKANPAKSEAQAFAAVYTAPENVDLKKRYDREEAGAKAAKLEKMGAVA